MELDDPAASTVASPTRLDLKAGALINLRLISRGTDRRIGARLIGVLDHVSLIVQLQDTSPIPVTLEPDDTLYVRSIAGPVALGFTTFVLRACRSPYVYYHLKYPDRIDVVQLRQAHRVRAALPALVRNHAGHTRAVQVCEISETGALIHAAAGAFEVGDTLLTTLHLVGNGVRKRLDLRCVVRSAGAATSADTHGNPDECRYGLQFQALAETEWTLLLAFVRERLDASAAPLDA